MQTAKCLSCSSDVIVQDDAFEGDIVECANCDAILEITSLHPVRLEIVEEGGHKDEEGNRIDDGYGRDEEPDEPIDDGLEADDIE